MVISLPGKASDTVTTPYGIDTNPSIKVLPVSVIRASDISVEPPPISNTKARLIIRFNSGIHPTTAKRASSLEEITSIGNPVSLQTACSNSLQFKARRQAAVATKRILISGEYSSIIPRHTFNADTVRRIAVFESILPFIMPSPKRVTLEKVSTT